MKVFQLKRQKQTQCVRSGGEKINIQQPEAASTSQADEAQKRFHPLFALFGLVWLVDFAAWSSFPSSLSFGSKRMYAMTSSPGDKNPFCITFGLSPPKKCIVSNVSIQNFGYITNSVPLTFPMFPYSIDQGHEPHGEGSWAGHSYWRRM